MLIINPPVIVPPNVWEFAVLDLPTAALGEPDPRESHAEAIPEQVQHKMTMVFGCFVCLEARKHAIQKNNIQYYDLFFCVFLNVWLDSLLPPKRGPAPIKIP